MRFPIAQTLVTAGILLTAIPVAGQGGSSCAEPTGPGFVERFCYDARGRLIVQRRSDGQQNDYAYDDANNRTSSAVQAATVNIVVVPNGGRPLPIILPPQ